MAETNVLRFKLIKLIINRNPNKSPNQAIPRSVNIYLVSFEIA